MKDEIRAFLSFLRLNRNASAHTVRAYESDSVAAPHLHGGGVTSVRGPILKPADITRPVIRGFLADLFHAGESRSSAARKLAAAPHLPALPETRGTH